MGVGGAGWGGGGAHKASHSGYGHCEDYKGKAVMISADSDFQRRHSQSPPTPFVS